jgi:hypothetical protein
VHFLSRRLIDTSVATMRRISSRLLNLFWREAKLTCQGVLLPAHRLQFFPPRFQK